LTKLTIPASELHTLRNTLAALPTVTEITITGLRGDTDANLAAIAQLDPAIRAKIHHIDLSESQVTDAGLVHLQALTQLRSLDLLMCRNITGAILQHFPFAQR